MTPTQGLQGQSPPAGGAERPLRLSVVIACLNGAATIEAQLEALARQQCPVTWELLLCDNGSTDGTLDIVRRYAGRLPLVVVDASADRGAGAARNLGARTARGDWLAFCDADDVVGEGWLVAMAGALERHSFVAGRFEAALLNSRRTLRSRSLDQQDGLQHSPTGLGLPHAGAGNMGIRRDVFLGVGGFDRSVPCLEDTDLSWRVQRAGVELVYVPEAVVHVRLRSSLRSMYRQGVDYGDAHAFLERRYGQPAGTVAQRAAAARAAAVSPSANPSGAASAPTSATPGGSASAGRAAVRRLRATTVSWLGPQPSLSRFVWQWGWHRGYRHGHARPAVPAVEPADVEA